MQVYLKSPAAGFQSSGPRVEGDQQPRSHPQWHLHRFNPRPSRGGRFRLIASQSSLELVSIRAPRVEGDPTNAHRNPKNQQVSIRWPLAWRAIQGRVTLHTSISNPPSVEGDLHNCDNTATVKLQSAPSREGDFETLKKLMRLMSFIRALAWRRFSFSAS